MPYTISYEMVPGSFGLKNAIEATDKAQIEILKSFIRTRIRNPRRGAPPSFDKLRHALLNGEIVSRRDIFLSTRRLPNQKEVVAALDAEADIFGPVIRCLHYIETKFYDVAYWIPTAVPAPPPPKRGPGRPPILGKRSTISIVLDNRTAESMRRAYLHLGLGSRNDAILRALQMFVDERPAPGPWAPPKGLKGTVTVMVPGPMLATFETTWRELGYRSRTNAAEAAVERWLAVSPEVDSVRQLIGHTRNA